MNTFKTKGILKRGFIEKGKGKIQANGNRQKIDK